MKECTRYFKSDRTAGQSDDVDGCQCGHMEAVPNTMQFVVRRLHRPFSAYKVSTQERIVKHSLPWTGCQTPPGSIVREVRWARQREAIGRYATKDSITVTQWFEEKGVCVRQ